MVDIDKRHIVEHVKVLSRIAHQAGGFSSRLDARQLLRRLDDVGATADGGQLVNALGIESQGVEVCSSLNARGTYFNGLKGFGQRFQMDLQRLVNMIHLDAFFFITYARNAKCGRQFHGKVEITLLVGGHAFGAVLQKDIGPDDAFAVIGIIDKTGNMYLLGLGKEGSENANQEKGLLHGASVFRIDEYRVAGHGSDGGKYTATVFHIAVEVNGANDAEEEVGIGIGFLKGVLAFHIMVSRFR